MSLELATLLQQKIRQNMEDIIMARLRHALRCHAAWYMPCEGRNAEISLFMWLYLTYLPGLFGVSASSTTGRRSEVTLLCK